MAKKRTGAERCRDSKEASTEDTAVLSLSKEDRARLCMDAWEPSLLRKLLRAQNKLRRHRER